jgi:hypothetical protein
MNSLNNNDLYDRMNVYVCERICGCCETTVSLFEQLAMTIDRLCNRLCAPPDNVREFRVSTASSTGDELRRKCQKFVEDLCREKRYDPSAPVTHQMDAEIKSNREEEVRNFIREHFQQASLMMEVFNTYNDSLQNLNIRKIN